ncbi:MAG: hypothetical protein H6835_17780 [Planctomycetes bacterium]|nr:hypothetical protein [Planctomycetota bacterium]
MRLTIGDCSSHHERGVPRPAQLPIVTDDETVAGPVELDVHVGEVAAIELPAPVYRRLEGPVLAGGRSVRAADRVRRLDRAERIDREFYSAQLYPIAKAHEQPFFAGHHQLPLEFGMQRQPLGDAGVFTFEGLQPGTWVLRLVSRQDEILVQRVVRVVRDELLELGRLEPAPRVVPRLKLGLDRKSLRIALADPDAPDGVFVADVDRRSDGTWAWPPLEPGTYLLQPLETAGEAWAFGGGRWPEGDPKQLTVHADGSTTPAALWTDEGK